jgi:hypothetical protein
MNTQQTRVPKFKFRVLVIGRANAGKTSILQRVCETTESPTIYRGKDEVRGLTFVSEYDLTSCSLPTRLNLFPQRMLVTIVLLLGCILTGIQRGEHRIDDELVFSKHTGYIFHDSQGIEAGDEEKLDTLRDFIRRKCGEKKLRDKLHAIWFGLSVFTITMTTDGYGLRYCVPMDDHRPGLNIRFFENICPDQNGALF